MAITLDVKINDRDPALIGIDELASAVRRLGRDGATFTVGEVCSKASSGRYTIAREYLLGLVSDGLAEDLGYRGVNKPGNRCFRILTAAAPAKVPQPTRAERVQQQIWNVLRGPHGREAVSAADLVMLASLPDTPISAGAAARYLNALCEAGYVALVPKRRPRSWRFVQRKKSGPRAPLMMQAPLVFDPNTHAVATRQLVAEGVTL